jgi:hypothetical protein
MRQRCKEKSANGIYDTFIRRDAWREARLLPPDVAVLAAAASASAAARSGNKGRKRRFGRGCAAAAILRKKAAGICSDVCNLRTIDVSDVFKNMNSPLKL